jgi:O-antigen ligase
MASTSRRLPTQLSNKLADGRLIVRATIIAAVIFLSAYLAQRPNIRIVLLPVFGVAAWLVLRYPGLGPLAVVFTALMTSFAIGTGTSTALHLPVLLVPAFVGLWLGKMLYRRSFRLVNSNVNLPLIGLVVTAALSFLAGNLPWDAFAQTAPLRAQLGALGVFVLAAGALLLVANEITERVWLRRLVWLFLALASTHIAARLVVPLQPYMPHIPQAAVGSMFWTWLVVLAAGQALFNHQLHVVWRLAAAALTVGTFMVGLAPDARSWSSGWLPGAAAIGVLLWLRWPRAMSAAGLVAVILGIINYSTVAGFLLAGDNQFSLITRQAAYEIVLRIVQANPLLGIGPANYYYYTPLYNLLGYYVSFNSHNQYVDLIAQTGVLGLVFFAWTMLALARTGWRLRDQVTDGFDRAYVNACLAGIVGLLAASALGDWVLPFVYNVGIAGLRAALLAWLFLGGLVAIDRWTNPPAPAPPGA